MADIEGYMSVILRTVRNGKVKVNGRWFKPHIRIGDPVPYHLERMRLAFGTYEGYANPKPFLSLWGTEWMFRAKSEFECNASWRASLRILTARVRAASWDTKPSDAVFVWAWWIECNS